MTETVLSAETQISRSDSVVAADVADDAILLDIDSGYFFQLNSTAARIWNLLEQPRSFASLCAELARDFPGGEAAIADDVRAFVADLEERGVIALG